MSTEQQLVHFKTQVLVRIVELFASISHGSVGFVFKQQKHTATNNQLMVAFLKIYCRSLFMVDKERQGVHYPSTTSSAQIIRSERLLVEITWV